MSTFDIQSIKASQILDSRGNPTVKVVIVTKFGTHTAAVPSGASKGSYEALELRDGDPLTYGGQGVLKAVKNVNEILGPAIMTSGLPLSDQKGLDQLLLDADGSKDKSKLGANAILGVSMALARAGAASKGVELYEHIGDLAGIPKSRPFVLPVPCTNQINGGVHSGNPLAPQEFMVLPVGGKSMAHAVQMAAEVYHTLKNVIAEKYGKGGTGVGDEGGFAPPVSTAYQALTLLTVAVERAGHTGAIEFAIDPASSEFYRGDKYDLDFKQSDDEKHDTKTSSQLADMYRSLMKEFPVTLLEDPFAEDDWAAWTAFTEGMKTDGDSLEITGDDLLATNIERIKIAVEKKACNSLLLKINQIGTISESIEAAKLAYSSGWSVFVSHRSGETTDDFIADLVVGLRTGHIKSGAPCRGERLAKYNRLMEIEMLLGGKGVYAGRNFRTAHIG